MSKNIGILGSGAVAKALGAGFIKHGYNVMLGTTNPAKLDEWKSKNDAAQIGSFEDAAKFGDIVVIAVKGHAAIDVVTSAGIANLAGKTVIDTTNPIDETKPPVNGVLNYFTTDKSLLELLQDVAPDANFVKAFNSIGSHLMVNPPFPQKATMFICGDNDEARKEVSAILDQFGFEVEDSGKANAGRAVEALCILWCIPGFAQNRWTQGFRLMKL
ncbi:MAG: NAD(P)-binding domain-containing protein [Sphingobacteriales bacterium JAD_PAG50586_3]|nr:MAG: NAD(P)-binding domain-containing protein [Sphingobacteriales bacterium JAD_PAG50586_3]